ncbi:MAG: hypothetical protein ABSC37_03425 [Xanthobacteraceae bacterium]
MPSGGSRPGAGRPRGSTSVNNTKTREIIEKAAEEGILPLQVMFDNIRFYTKEADKLVAKLLGDGAPQLEVAEGERAASPHADIIEALKAVLGFRKAAGEEAARAAQYVHPRQGYAAEEPRDDGMPLAERIAWYMREDEIEASGGKVVELKPHGDRGACPSGSEPTPPPIS